MRDEPEFQQIVRDIEAKSQAEHERVRQWLEENDRCKKRSGKFEHQGHKYHIS